MNFWRIQRYIEAKKNITKIDVKTSIKKILGNIILKTNDKNILILEKIFNKINLKERSRNFLDLHNLNQKFYFDFCVSGKI